MELDGYNVETGDKLWCQLESVFGTVTSSTSEKVSVRFGSVKFNYDQLGERIGNKPDRIGRTLYWDDPTNYFVPGKIQALNDYMKAVATAVNNVPTGL